MAFKNQLVDIFGFSEPRYVRMPAVGINISDNSMKMMDLQPSEDGLLPARYENMSMPDGAVEAGIIKDDKTVTSLLKSLRKHYDLSFVRASIPEENGYIFSISLPNVSSEELKESIRFQLPEHVPLSVSESTFGYDIIDVNKKTGRMDVSVTVLPRDIVMKYEQIFSDAGLTPLSFEIEAQAISRAAVPEESDDTVMVVDIGRTRTGISIVANGIVRYTSTLQMGGDRLTQAVAKSLDVSIDEAEKLKQEDGFIKNKAHQELYTALASGISALNDEIQRRFRYWSKQSSGANHTPSKIEQIILIGGNASVPGLAEHIAEDNEVPVQIGNVWENAFSLDDYVPQIDFRHSLTYTTSVGLALSNLR